jgi:hypothetical protein
MAGYTTNPGLAETLGGLAQTFMGDPSRKMKAAQLRAQAGKFNQDRLASIQAMEIERAAEAERVALAQGLVESQRSLGKTLALAPGDVEKRFGGTEQVARPAPDFSGPMPMQDDLYTAPEINNRLAAILSGMTGNKDAHAAAINTISANEAMGFGDRAQRIVGLGKPGTTAALDSLTDRRETDRLDDTRGNIHAIALDNQQNTHAINKTRVEAGLKPLKSGDILTGPLAEATDMTQERVNTEGDRQSELAAQEQLRLEARKGIQDRMTNAQKYYNERLMETQKAGDATEAARVEGERKTAMAELEAELKATYAPLVPGQVQTAATETLTGVPRAELQAIDDAQNTSDTNNTIRINNAKPGKGGTISAKIYFYRNDAGKLVQGTTHDGGLTDAHTGARLPQGTQVTTKTITGTAAEVGQGPSLKGTSSNDKANTQRVRLESLKTGIADARAIILQKPDSVGWRGNIQRLAQSAVDSFGASAEGLMADMSHPDNEITKEMQKAISDGFNPDLATMENRFLVLAYGAASAVAGQEGRGLSDADVKHWRRIVGDPTAWLSGPNDALAQLDHLEQQLERAGVSLDQLGIAKVPDAETSGAPGGEEDITGNNPQVEAILERVMRGGKPL